MGLFFLVARHSCASRRQKLLSIAPKGYIGVSRTNLVFHNVALAQRCCSERRAMMFVLDGPPAAQRCGRAPRAVMAGRCSWATTRRFSTRSSKPSGSARDHKNGWAALGSKSNTIFIDAQAALKRIRNDDPGPGQWLVRRILRTER
jgi:hypothetical protein